MYLKGEGVADPKEAADSFQEGVRPGTTRTCRDLAFRYLN